MLYQSSFFSVLILFASSHPGTNLVDNTVKNRLPHSGSVRYNRARIKKFDHKWYEALGLFYEELAYSSLLAINKSVLLIHRGLACHILKEGSGSCATQRAQRAFASFLQKSHAIKDCKKRDSFFRWKQQEIYYGKRAETRKAHLAGKDKECATNKILSKAGRTTVVQRNMCLAQRNENSLFCKKYL